jgi:hypothetical protein
VNRVLGKEMAGSGRDGGHVAGLPGQPELAGAGGCRVADRVGEVPRLRPEPRRDRGPAVLDLAAHHRFGVLGEHRVREGVGADCKSRLAGQLRELVPAHAMGPDEFGRDDAGLLAPSRERVAQHLFGSRPQSRIGESEGGALLVGRSARMLLPCQADPLLAADDLLEFQPPEPPGAGCILGRDEQRPGRPVAAQDRERIVAVVAVAIVEGQRTEGRAALPGREPARNLVERDDGETRLPKHPERQVEMFGRDREQRVRLERIGPRRPDMVKGQDDAAAAGERRQPTIRAGAGDGSEPGPDHAMFETGAHACPPECSPTNLAAT